MNTSGWRVSVKAERHHSWDVSYRGNFYRKYLSGQLQEKALVWPRKRHFYFVFQLNNLLFHKCE